MIIFLCDASSFVGFGHLNRSLVLARALHFLGESCIMVGPHEKYFQQSDRAVFQDWIGLDHMELFFESPHMLVKIANQHASNLLVLDDYRVDENFQKALKEKGLHYLLFDNGGRDSIYADIVVNVNPRASESHYGYKLKTQESHLLLGLEYSILRSEFLTILKTYKNPKTRVLITLGGGDDRGAMLFILRTLSKAKDIEFLVVLGRDNPNILEVKQWILDTDLSNIVLEVDSSSIAELFASCDLAITSGGTTMHELASIGLPMMVIAIAENQIQHANDWEKSVDFIKFIGSFVDLCPEDLTNAFEEFLSGPERSCAKSVIDGFGSIRVASELVKIRKKYEKYISIESC